MLTARTGGSGARRPIQLTSAAAHANTFLMTMTFFGFLASGIEYADNFRNVASNVTAGVGYGRHIDATSLAKIVRMENALQKEDIITGDIPKEFMLKIAQIIEREAEYKDRYGEAYEVEWVNDMEKEIIASKMVEQEGVGAVGIFRMRQVLFGINQIVNPRFYGWDGQVGAAYTISTPDTTDPGDVSLFLGGRFSYPISWRAQINTKAEFRTPFDDLFGTYNAEANADFIYELSNRINFTTGYQFGVRGSDAETLYEHRLDAGFLFYLENAVAFGLNASLEKVGDQPRQMGTSASLQYNLFQ